MLIGFTNSAIAVLNCQGNYILFPMHKLFNKSKDEIGKKKTKLRTFWGRKKKEKITITMIFISAKNLLQKEWSGIYIT